MLGTYLPASALALALALLACGVEAARPAPRSSASLAPLGPNDVEEFVKELPGENLGDGGEFSVGSRRFVRLEGRHLTFRTASGVKRCVIGAAEAKAWTFGDAGVTGCGDVRLAKRPNKRVKDDAGQPVVLTVTQGGRVSTMNGLWQGLE